MKISLKNDCNSCVETFALLDTGSQGTFIDEDVLKEINATGLDTTISVKTIHGERTDKCKVIEGLVVSPNGLMSPFVSHFHVHTVNLLFL